MKKGFTLLELILSITLLGIIVSSMGVVFGDMLSDQNIRGKSDELIEVLREARANAVSNKKNSAWGVKFDPAGENDHFTLFKGNSFPIRDASFDFSTELPKTIALSASGLTGGANEVVFSKYTGSPSANGNVTLTSETESVTLEINSAGMVDHH